MKFLFSIFILYLIHELSGTPCKIRLETHTQSKIAGELSCYGDDAKGSGVHGIELSFNILQAPNLTGPSLTLSSPLEEKLAEFYWDGHTVTPTLYGYDDHSTHHTDLFQDSDQYRILPALSTLLGEDYNVTARSWPISIVLYRLALAAENRHGTDAAMEQHFASQSQRREGTWSRSRRSIEKKECHSPGGTCDARTELEDDSHCNDHGVHLNEVDVENSCNGMCGPGCSRCWIHICGDCCKHPGCLSHDNECAQSYLNWSCITGKGVLWHTADDKC